MVISVNLGVEERIPERSFVCLIMEKAPRENVRMHSWSGIHSMCTCG